MAYIMTMEFIETPTFTRLVNALLSEEEQRQLQNDLLANPERGSIIRGGGGIRKVRFAIEGTGKSGGARVIYYWAKSKDQIYMLLIYPKSNQDNLTDQQTAILRDYVKEL